MTRPKKIDKDNDKDKDNDNDNETKSEVADPRPTPDSSPPSALITSVSPSQEDLETQKRKTASAIVTSGALTLVLNFLVRNIS